MTTPTAQHAVTKHHLPLGAITRITCSANTSKIVLEDNGTLLLPLTVTSLDHSLFERRSIQQIDLSAIPGLYIDEECFTCNTCLTELILNKHVYIGPNAFWHCDALTSVSFLGDPSLDTPDDFRPALIGSYAFAYCRALRVVIGLPDTVVLESNAFFYCKELSGSFRVGGSHQPHLPADIFFKTAITSLIIAPGTRSIGSHCCHSCTSLVYVDLSSSIENIHSEAFSECSKLPTITLGAECTSVEAKAFYKCTSLHTVHTDKSNCEIHFGKAAFGHCSALTGFTIPFCTSQLSSAMFSECASLASIRGGEHLTHIASHCFSGCHNLAFIDTECMSHLQCISAYVFQGGNKITSLNLMHTRLSHLDAHCFVGMSTLQSLSLPATLVAGHPSMITECTALTTLQIPHKPLSPFLTLLLPHLLYTAKHITVTTCN